MQGRLAARQAKIAVRRARSGSDDPDLERLEADIQAQMDRLSVQMDVLSQRMEPLSDEQSRLGEEQSRASRRMQEEMDQLLREAREDGRAQRIGE